MVLSDLERTLLAHVSHPDYRPVKPKAIAKALKLDGDAARKLKRSIKALVRDGKLAYGPNRVVGLVGGAGFRGVRFGGGSA